MYVLSLFFVSFLGFVVFGYKDELLLIRLFPYVEHILQNSDIIHEILAPIQRCRRSESRVW